MFGGQPNHGWQVCFPLSLHAVSWTSDIFIDEMVGPDALVVVRPVGFPLLQYSVLCTVQIFSLLYLLLYPNLYVLGDSSWISFESFMQSTIYLS